MDMRTMWMLIVLAVIIAAGMGCSEDERLAGFAERSVQTQQRQNETIARQSERVVEESHALAETAKELVAADAQARGEIIAAQHQLHTGLHEERVNVDRQREMLEQERQAIASQRHRDPILAASLNTLGIIIASMLPLLLAAYALGQMNQPVDENAELGQLLIDEFTSSQPMLLPPQVPLLSQSRPSDPGSIEPPF
jgi:hypothetical protein